MAQIAHGIDVVDCGRIEQMLRRHDERFLERVFTAREQADAAAVKNRVEKLSGRFAAKEAVMKLVGTGWRDGVAWTDIEVVNNPLGQPLVTLSGKVRALAESQRLGPIALSISHTSTLAMASAVALIEEQ